MKVKRSETFPTPSVWLNLRVGHAYLVRLIHFTGFLFGRDVINGFDGVDFFAVLVVNDVMFHVNNLPSIVEMSSRLNIDLTGEIRQGHRMKPKLFAIHFNQHNKPLRALPYTNTMGFTPTDESNV